jgi:hypothetical protein
MQEKRLPGLKQGPLSADFGVPPRGTWTFPQAGRLSTAGPKCVLDF